MMKERFSRLKDTRMHAQVQHDLYEIFAEKCGAICECLVKT